MRAWPGAILIGWAVIGIGAAAAGDSAAPAPSPRPDAGTQRSAEPAVDDAEVTANLELLEELPTLEDLDLIQNLNSDE